MGSSDSRNTQIDMLSCEQTKSLRETSERARLRDSRNNSGTSNIDTPKQKRARSPDVALDATTGTRVAKSKIRPATASSLQLQARWEPPWLEYEKIYDVDLDGTVAVAVRKAPPVELVHVRAFPKPTAEKTLHIFRQVQHQNIVAAIEVFTTHDGLYIALEHMPVSLEWIVRSPAYPDERQLAAILGQILNGIAYLARKGFQHGSLRCANILLKANGDVKIANQECCHVMSQRNGESYDIRALSSITMELMQKYLKDGGAIGIDDLHRWPPNSDAVRFLSATTSAKSAAELLKHPLLSCPWQKDSLIGMISLAQVCIRGRYKYIPGE
ncbi:hypothetical protein CC80DRAFT_521099 [Byssothecium circinans]|uniref:Protein kinase domain-containing protein n=1 Tax=Byssothecium circinans TaxID=147558 RepID=A0A6A5THZ0_9PLEO|nr:hypothetical protein CC80DRAFT_521099 [Byssothecium circinans]